MLDVFDSDVHLHEAPVDLAPYCVDPWRRALTAETGPERWLDTPGYSPLTPLDAVRGDDPGREPYVVRTPDQMRADLDRRGVGSALLITDRFIGLAQAQDDDYARAISSAYNRYLRERWIDPARGLYGAILIPPQDPAAAVAEIEAYAGDAGVAAIVLSTVHTFPLWGDQAYDPIFAAAQAARLPLVLHGATTYGTVFPYQLQAYQTPIARGALAQPLGAIANLTSLVETAALARFPDLRVVFCEAGLAWLPFVSSRLDGQYRHLRASVPGLTMRPSDYVRRQVWTSLHPLGDLEDASHLAHVIDLIGADRILFGSDWPHYDREEPADVGRALPEDARAAIMGQNARALFRR